ncbi:hypothetical protein GCK32_007646 [Trichostrongylus colubriformis]|uniref:Zc3h12a-like Ribonuclease NYN domain-containing protein n=1 Tax=Trichostrongylus colubriformis TaxID=6319 RepID=A0AAN8F000_TRICO
MATTHQQPSFGSAENRKFSMRLNSSESSISDRISQSDDDSETWVDCPTTPQQSGELQGSDDAAIDQRAPREDVTVTEDPNSRGQQTNTDSKGSCATKTSSQPEPTSNDNKSKAFVRGALFGAGFPSGPPPSGNVIVLPKEEEQQLPRYREASDCEWDALMEKQRKAAGIVRTASLSHRIQRKEGPDRYPKKEAMNNGVQSASRTAEVDYERRPAHERQGYQSENYAEARRRTDDSAKENSRRKDNTQQSNLVYKNYSTNAPRNRRTATRADFLNACRLLIGSESEDEQFCDECRSVVGSRFGAHHSKSESSEKSYLPIRPSCKSSVLIDEFVNADLNAGMESSEIRRRGDSRLIDDLLHNIVYKFFSSTTFTSGALSVIVDLFEFPPALFSRPADRLLRPVMIDGCAVSGCFDREYSVYWGRIKDTTKLSWTRCKVLSMKPIYQCLVEFLLHGHKVTILLPAYYRDVSFNDLRSKVDDVEAFNVLLDLKLIQFIDKVGTNIMDEIRMQVDKVDALLVSSGSFDARGEWQCSSFTAFDSPDKANSSLPTAFTRASKRMLTPIFFGRNQDMTIVYAFQTKEGGTWRSVPEKVLCYYEPCTDSDRNIDEAGRLCQQLLFEDQVKVLLAVKDLFEWSCLHRRGISGLLRLNFLALLSA